MDKKQEQMSKRKKIVRTCLVLVGLGAFLTLAFFVLKWTGVISSLSSLEKVRDYILSWGIWGRLIFVVLQFLQVTFIPLPSTVTTLAGVAIYGPLEAAALSFVGIMLGSIVAFWIGRKFGKKVVVFMVGEETCKKWRKVLSNGKYTFFMMMVFPMFPDDVLCLVAGLTTMSWPFFIITNCISRPIGILMTSYLGSGQLIPYHGWGLAVWAVLIVVFAVLMFLSYKYKDKIEGFLLKIVGKKKKDSENSKQSQSNSKTIVETEINEVDEKTGVVEDLPICENVSQDRKE